MLSFYGLHRTAHFATPVLHSRNNIIDERLMYWRAPTCILRGRHLVHPLLRPLCLPVSMLFEFGKLCGLLSYVRRNGLQGQWEERIPLDIWEHVP